MPLYLFWKINQDLFSDTPRSYLLAHVGSISPQKKLDFLKNNLLQLYPIFSENNPIDIPYHVIISWCWNPYSLMLCIPFRLVKSWQKNSLFIRMNSSQPSKQATRCPRLPRYIRFRLCMRQSDGRTTGHVTWQRWSHAKSAKSLSWSEEISPAKTRL